MLQLAITLDEKNSRLIKYLAKQTLQVYPILSPGMNSCSFKPLGQSRLLFWEPFRFLVLLMMDELIVLFV